MLSRVGRICVKAQITFYLQIIATNHILQIAVLGCQEPPIWGETVASQGPSQALRSLDYFNADQLINPLAPASGTQIIKLWGLDMTHQSNQNFQLMWTLIKQALSSTSSSLLPTYIYGAVVDSTGKAVTTTSWHYHADSCRPLSAVFIITGMRRTAISSKVVAELEN